MKIDISTTEEKVAALKLQQSIAIIEGKMTRLRHLALFADKNAKDGLNFVEAAAPFFREHGLEIVKILRSVVPVTEEEHSAIKKLMKEPSDGKK